MNIRMKILSFAATALALVICGNSCQGKNGSQTAESAGADTTQQAAVPQFSADSAYAYVKAQCDFGPRVPGTDAHKRCAAYLEQALRATCDSVMVQHGNVTTFDGKNLNISNVIGVVNPSAEQRILLMAHWDCRPWADQDSDASKHHEPVMGANDGASGVGVLLELARMMKAQRPNVGIDIVLVDAEDWGDTDSDNEDSWALGTQYWCRNPHYGNAKPIFGVVVDMVGASGAKFSKEYFSMQYGSSFVDLVWTAAAEAGYGNFFVANGGGAVTDDHVSVNKIAGIPCIDIIDMRTDSKTGFYDGWHTTHDTFDRIDPATLKAVGQTLAQVIYSY